MTETHLKSHGLVMAEYKARFPEAVLVDEASRAAYAAKMTGRAGKPHTEESKQLISERKREQYANDQELRERVSAGTRAGMAQPDARERYLAAIAGRDISGERNPFFGRHHTEEMKRALTENVERSAKISAKRIDWWQPRLGQTVEQLYGEEVGQRIRATLAEKTRGERNPAFGKVYENTGWGYCGRYKGFFFRSTWEYSFYKHLESCNIDFTTVKHEPCQIPYVLDGRNRTYTPDFLVGTKLIEIKPCYRMNLKIDMFIAKCAAARAYCAEHGLTFEVLTEADFPIVSYRHAFADPDVVWLRGGPKAK